MRLFGASILVAMWLPMERAAAQCGTPGTLGIPHISYTSDLLDSNITLKLQNALPERCASELPLEEEPRVVRRMATLFNTFEVQGARLKGALRIGTQEVEEPFLEFDPIFAEPNLGRPFLERFVVTFDLPHHRLRLQPPDGKVTSHQA